MVPRAPSAFAYPPPPSTASAKTNYEAISTNVRALIANGSTHRTGADRVQVEALIIDANNERHTMERDALLGEAATIKIEHLARLRDTITTASSISSIRFLLSKGGPLVAKDVVTRIAAATLKCQTHFAASADKISCLEEALDRNRHAIQGTGAGGGQRGGECGEGTEASRGPKRSVACDPWCTTKPKALHSQRRARVLGPITLPPPPQTPFSLKLSSSMKRAPTAAIKPCSTKFSV